MSDLVPEAHVRRARADDASTIEDLSSAARDTVRDQRGGSLWLRRDALPSPLSVSDLLERPDALVLVGSLDELAVGYAIAFVEALADGTTLARVAELFVLDAARELGVGELLLSSVVEWATRAGCTGIDALALPGDRATKNFFETAGLVARAIVVHRALTPRTP